MYTWRILTKGIEIRDMSQSQNCREFKRYSRTYK